MKIDQGEIGVRKGIELMETEIMHILDSIREIPQKDRDTIIEYLDHREWGVAFEILYSTLEQENIPVGETLCNELLEIGHRMNLEPFSMRKYKCVCCGNYTLGSEPPGTFDICPVCFWEDDPVQYDDPDYAGGANGISLNQARVNFAKNGGGIG